MIDTASGIRHRRWSTEEKAETLRRFEASGLSREEFARQASLAPSSLSNWIRKRASISPQPGLVPVQVKAAAPSDPALVEIVLRGGRRIRVSQGFDADLLRKVIAALEC